MSLQLPFAERTRFELVDRIAPIVGLANRWFQPLTHLSKKNCCMPDFPVCCECKDNWFLGIVQTFLEKNGWPQLLWLAHYHYKVFKAFKDFNADGNGCKKAGQILQKSTIQKTGCPQEADTRLGFAAKPGGERATKPGGEGRQSREGQLPIRRRTAPSSWLSLPFRMSAGWL